MKRPLSTSVIIGGLLISCLACLEIRPLPSPKDSPSQVTSAKPCQAPPIEQNIIGTWKGGIAKSTPRDTISKTVPISRAIFDRIGTITFDSNKQVSDPDSLFENYIDQIGPVISKAYNAEIDTTRYGSYRDLGELFWVRLYVKNRTGITVSTGYYFKVILNECKRIHLKGPHGAYELVLVR